MKERDIRGEDGTRLRALEHGSAASPVLLLCHSLGTDASLWDAQVPAWGRRFRVLRYDLRGHGGSEAPPGPYTIEQLGRDALAVLDAFGVARAHLCGISLGGLVATWVGGHAHDRVDRLVIADTATKIGSEDAWMERAGQARSAGMPVVAAVALDRFFSSAFTATAAGRAARARFERVLLETSAEGYASNCAALAHADLFETARRIEAETLVMTGDLDEATPVESGRLLASLIRSAEFEVISRAGHLANVEVPVRFARTVTEFLTRGRSVR